MQDGRIVDQHVESPVHRPDMIDECDPRSLVCDIEVPVRTVRRDCGYLTAIVEHVGDNHRRSCFDECFDDAGPGAASTPGDDRDLACEPAHGSPHFRPPRFSH